MKETEQTLKIVLLILKSDQYLLPVVHDKDDDLG